MFGMSLDHFVNLFQTVQRCPEDVCGKASYAVVEVFAFSPERALYLLLCLLAHVGLKQHLQRQFP